MSKKSASFFSMQSVTSCISTTLVLLLLGMVFFLVLTAGNMSAYIRENIAFTTILTDDMKETDILRLQKTLQKEPFVRRIHYISRQQALKEQTLALGTDPSEFIGYNPFSASIEIRLRSAYANPDSLRWIEQKLLANKHIVEVSYPQELLQSVHHNLRRVSLLLLSLAALLTLISFALINSTIRLSIYSQRFLIHTMKLVGASRAFIRRPFLLRHVWTGLLAGVLANGLLVTMAWLLVDYEPQLIDIITPQVLLAVVAAVFVFGLLITALCSLISINKFLHMRVNQLYSY